MAPPPCSVFCSDRSAAPWWMSCACLSSVRGASNRSPSRPSLSKPRRSLTCTRSTTGDSRGRRPWPETQRAASQRLRGDGVRRSREVKHEQPQTEVSAQKQDSIEPTSYCRLMFPVEIWMPQKDGPTATFALWREPENKDPESVNHSKK